MLPIFLWSGTMIAPLITDTAQNVGAFPTSLDSTQMISHSTKEGPVEGMLAMVVGKAVSNPQVNSVLLAGGSMVAYLLLFIWYAGKMKVRNRIYAEEKDPKVSTTADKAKLQKA